jgi:zinc/manganese transport system permease protein
VSWELLDWIIIGPALVAGLLVLSTHVPLGQEVLKHGIIFIDLAIAQVAALGVIAAGYYGWDDNQYLVQIAAVSAALVAAAALYWTEKHWQPIQEALIGTLFILAATGSILMLTNNPHGGDYLKDLLVGQILWTTWQSLIPITILYGLLLPIWFAGQQRFGRAGFYITFAIAVTAAVQIVGVYLVFASLILPALATRRLSGLKRITGGYVVGILSYLAGIVLSALFDLPTGAVIVWTMAVLSAIAGFIIGSRAVQRSPASS